MEFIAGGVAILAVGAGLAGLMYTAYRVSREPAFSPQTRQLGFWAVLFVPALVWLTGHGSGPLGNRRLGKGDRSTATPILGEAARSDLRATNQ